MSIGLKLTQIGDEVVVVVPKEALEEMDLNAGDTVYLTKKLQGMESDPREQKILRQMEVAERVMRENRNLLRKLAQ